MIKVKFFILIIFGNYFFISNDFLGTIIFVKKSNVLFCPTGRIKQDTHLNKKWFLIVLVARTYKC